MNVERNLRADHQDFAFQAEIFGFHAEGPRKQVEGTELGV